MTASFLARASIILTVATLATAVSLPSAGAAAAAKPRDRVLQLERVSQENVDLGAAGPSVGDLRVTQGVATNSAGKRVGTYATSQVTVAAALVGGSEQRSVIMEMTLPGGEITMVGVYVAPAGAAPTSEVVHVIAGGTGAFFGARGTITLTPTGATTYRATLTFA